MADEDQTQARSREALSPFLAAALRARGPAELSSGSADETVTVEVQVGDIRHALVIYENDLGGARLVDWIAEGRAARVREGREETSGHAYVLEVASPNGEAPSTFQCADLDAVRDRIDEAAAASVEAMREFLGAEAAAPGELEAQLGRQAFRRLSGQISGKPGEAARFDLPDRPWLCLSLADGPGSTGAPPTQK